MRLKPLSRPEGSCSRERVSDLDKVVRNPDPALHPLQRATEVTRAVAAAKLARVFAKPLVGALDGHTDSVTCLARSPRASGVLLSGAADGQLLLWDIAARTAVASLGGHKRAVRGVACAPDGRHAVSVGDDALVCLWQLPGRGSQEAAAAEVARLTPTASYSSKHAFRDVDYHRSRLHFATAGATVQLWDHERSEPIAEFTWGVDAVSAVRFNPAEPDLFASCGSDRRCGMRPCSEASLVRERTDSPPLSCQHRLVRHASGNAPAQGGHAEAGKHGCVESV